jgi:YfiH family protein
MLKYGSKEKIYREHGEGPRYLGFEEWEEKFQDISHGFTTRVGGVSEGVLSSMNLSYTRGDDPDAVDENYRRAAAYFGKEPSDIVTISQEHTNRVVVVDQSNAGEGVTKERTLGACDGMITNTPGLLLSTSHADCTPLFFVDPVKKVVAMTHSGWRGTATRIGKNTIEQMEQAFSCRPSDIHVAIGPCICADCYEIGEDVAEAFASTFQGDVEGILRERGKGKYDLDLTKANQRILLEAGVKKEHMLCGNLCTCCNKDLLFSHRGAKGQRGNMSAFIMLTEM